MKVAIVSANYGGYDTVKPAPALDLDEADCFYFTDNGDTADAAMRVGWQPIVRTVRGESNERTCKRPKILGHQWLPHYPVQVYCDATHYLNAETVLDALEFLPLALFPHPDRADVISEANASQHQKYKGQPIADQARWYVDNGLPNPWRLWETGFMVRDVSLPSVVALCEAWWAEVERWGSHQCQVSLPWAAWATGTEVRDLPHAMRSNPWFTMSGHLR